MIDFQARYARWKKKWPQITPDEITQAQVLDKMKLTGDRKVCIEEPVVLLRTYTIELPSWIPDDASIAAVGANYDYELGGMYATVYLKNGQEFTFECGEIIYDDDDQAESYCISDGKTFLTSPNSNRLELPE